MFAKHHFLPLKSKQSHKTHLAPLRNLAAPRSILKTRSKPSLILLPPHTRKRHHQALEKHRI